MLAGILLEPRLAFLSLCALLLGTATPLAIAWARLLPEEPSPFRFERSSRTKLSAAMVPLRHSNASRDPFAIVLLIFVTMSFLYQLPGLPRDFLISQAASLIPEPWLHDLLLFSRGFFITIPVLAAVYSLFRPNEIRLPLILAGVLVPLLWLASPWLRAAFLAI
jgi:hypothetical protein